jgi:signal peptidase I
MLAWKQKFYKKTFFEIVYNVLFLRITFKALIAFFALIFFVREFFFAPFYIPTNSMEPTLVPHEIIMVNKLSYGIGKNHSKLLFFMPSDFRLFNAPVEPGDIVVFKLPQDSQNYVKRVIARGGDRVQMRGGILYINHKPLKLKHVITQRNTEGKIQHLYIQTLSNGHPYTFIREQELGFGPGDNTEEFVVPHNHYFVMGDNIHNSADSRRFDVIGYIPHDSVIGKAEFILFTHKAEWYEIHKWLTHWNFARLFHNIH